MAANKIQDLLQCPICLGQLRQPRMLPCFHSFCESCLETHIQISSQDNQSYFPCPSCRILTKTPHNRSQGFSRDFRLIKFTDVLHSVIGQGKSSLCDVCSSESIYENASTFCAECEKHFCINCTIRHKLKPYLAAHLLINLQDDSNQTEDKCVNHFNEAVRFKCRTCDLELCVVCILKGHEGHSIIRLESEKLTVQRRLTTTFKTVHENICKIHEDIFNLTCLDGQLKGHYAESKTLIQKKSRTLIQKILQEEKKFLKELNEDFFEKRLEVDQLKDLYRGNLKRLETYQSQLRCLMSAEQTDTNLQEEILRHINLQQREINKKYLTTLNTFKKFIPGRLFHFGKFTEISLQQDDSRIFDSATNFTEYVAELTSNHGDESCDNPRQSRSSEENELSESDELIQSNVNTNLKIPFAISVQRVSSFRHHHKQHEEFGLPYNLCFTKNEQIIVAENGKKRIQILDKYGYSIKMIAEGQIIPRGIALINDKEIAITDELTKNVKIFNLEGDLLKEFLPICMTLPYGITTSHNGDLLLTDMIFETVTVIKPDGDLRYQFGGHGYSNNYFDNPGYLIVDSKNRILVSDSGNHCVKVFTKHGHYLFKFGSFGPGNLHYPKGLAIDVFGNILVVDSGNDRVVMFSKEGTYLSTILDKSHGLHRPTGICLSQTNLLAVSMPDLGNICIFEISS